MSKRPRTPSEPVSKTPAASKLAGRSTPGKANAKPEVAEPQPTSTAEAGDPAKSSEPAKPGSTVTGVSARAVQQAARAAEPGKPAAPAKGRVRAAVEAVIEIAGKLGEEVLERVTGAPEPVPMSAYLSPPVPEDIRAEPAPVPEDSGPADYLAPVPQPAEDTAAPSPGPGLGALDRHLLCEGMHMRLFEKLGAQVQAAGVHFAVWAPNARYVSVIGEWNGWDPSRDPLVRDGSGVWQGLVPAAAAGMLYKYRVIGVRGEVMDRADPCAQATELPPQTASRIVAIEHRWNDAAWLAARARRQGPGAPISVYEVHLGSWLRDEAEDFLGYADIAPRLVAHVRRLGFTHVEFMPITEHPFYGSWGYQTSAYFAPTARHGGPEGLMQLIDALHQADIGVILDWVPGHFPADAHGLARFDGTALYEHQDPRRGVHPDWNTLIFNFGRHEVRAFLLSSAMMWIERYHIDGIRVDAVASMLYLDYSRKPGQWLPNARGGRENLEAVAFLRLLNTAIHGEHPDVITIAEESTSWPGVTVAVAGGGLGFDYKWDMGWMHDTLRYLGRDPIARQYHHDELTFRMWYAYKERYMLPLSHDEVVHGKYSLIRKMHGDDAARFASLRLLLAYMFTTPGRKLLFMGGEFGQLREWNHDRQLDWALREQPLHAGLERWVARLAHLYREVPALHEQDDEPSGYEWLVVDDNLRSLAVYLRYPAHGPVVMVALNFTPVTWADHAVGVPAEGTWTLVDRSDARIYSDVEPATQPQRFEATQVPAHDRPFSLRVTLPPLTALVLEGPEVGELRAAAERHRVARIVRETEAVREAEAAEAAEAARVAEAARAAEEAAAQESERESEKSARVEEAGRSAADAVRRNDPPGSVSER